MHLELSNIALGLKCANCNLPLINLADHDFLQYLHSKSTSCSKCNAKLNLFNTLTHCIEENFFFNDVFSFVGAKRSVFQVKLNSSSNTTLTFEDHGIPKGSRILHINYTPQGFGTFPLEIHGNSPYRGAPRDSVTLYPAKLGDNETTSTSLSVMVTWLENGSLEDASLKSLVDAFEEYSRQEFETCIVPANTAIEFDVMRYTEKSLEIVSSKNNIKDFFKSGVSYVPTLKVLIPLLAKLNNFPAMPDELLASLVKLASLRNQIAHTGKTKEPLSKQLVASCLTGAILGKWYISALQNS